MRWFALGLKINSPIPVFIVHWNRPWECAKTVKCFLDQELPLKISIIDNSSQPHLIQILEDSIPQNADLIRLRQNKGWGGALNILLQQWMKEKGFPYCLVSAHDALVKNNCLKLLIESMQSDPQIGIACPEYGIPEIPRFTPIRGPRLIPTVSCRSNTVDYVDFPHGTLMLLRKQCIAQIGLFDERYFAYGDEYDLGLRARQRGWKVGLVWGAVVENPDSWTPDPLKTYLFARNSLLLAKTHSGIIYALLRAAMMFPNTLRLIPKSYNHEPNLLANSFVVARMLALRDFFLNRYTLPDILFRRN